MKSIQLKSLVLTAALSLVLFSCSPKDADIQKAISEKIATNPEMSGMTATVSKGVVTISGQCKDEAAKASCETLIKGLKGVKSIVNNCKIPAAVTINPDETLILAVQTALKNYAGVTSNVSQGVVTLTGKIKKDNLMPLMQSIQALNPKKVENKLIIK
jgi:hyperosmotically inducible periplasmic protein